MDEVDRLADNLSDAMDHLDRALDNEHLQLSIVGAKRVRRSVTILLRHLASLNAIAQGGTSK